MNSESGLSNEFIFLEISDGKGSAQFNIGSFSSILSIGTEVENEENNSTYPITLSRLT